MTERADLRGSLRRAGDTLLALMQTRLALLNTELQGGALLLWDSLVMAVAALVLLLVGLACGMTLLIMACPPSARLWVLAGALAVLCGSGVLLLVSARTRLAMPGGPFAASLEELELDREHMTAGLDSPPRR